MAKVADKYYKVDPWSIDEEGFEPVRNRVSESIFSLGNEYMGVRGYHEEGYSGDSLIGSYFNGLYDEMKLGAHYKGIIRRLRFMAYAVDWLYTRITTIDGELLDIATSTISCFTRKLDFKSGVLTREFIWHLKNGHSVRITFIRFVSMTTSHLGCQRVVFEPLDFSGQVEVRTGLDFATLHEDQGKNLWFCLQKEQIKGQCSIMAKTINTENRLFSSFKIHTSNRINPLEVNEEHDGLFDTPHIDIHSIPVTEFPLYANWSYDRLYRYDMIKQPDVLMFMFLHNQSFSLKAKRANYDYYEPRCIHESSLSPSIHSILASEIGKHDEAYKFFEFATRLDLDNYNRNTREGLHTTSIAAAWMNIVYGFGGMRSDGNGLILKPSLPSSWNSYSFKIIYQMSVLQITVDQEKVAIKILSGSKVAIQVYSKRYSIDSIGVQLPREELLGYELVD